MAKSIRSKVKKKHRSYMRATIGEKVRTANIEAAAARGAAKKAGKANTKTLTYMKGAMGAGSVDLGKAYYEAIVRHSQEPTPTAADDDDEDEDGDEDMEGAAAPAATLQPVATLQEEAICQMGLRTNEEKAVMKNQANKLGRAGKTKQGGSGIFSKRTRRRADITSSRPPKEMVKF